MFDYAVSIWPWTVIVGPSARLGKPFNSGGKPLAMLLGFCSLKSTMLMSVSSYQCGMTLSFGVYGYIDLAVCGYVRLGELRFL